MEKMNESIYEQITKDRQVYDANEQVLGALQLVYNILGELGSLKCSSIFDEVLCHIGEELDIYDTLLSTFNAEFKRQIDDKEFSFVNENLGEWLKK